MKNSTLILFSLAVILSNISNAQNWQINGNTLVGAGEFLGSSSGNFPLVLKTTPAQPINFFTNNTQRMTILGNNGYVGVREAALAITY